MLSASQMYCRDLSDRIEEHKRDRKQDRVYSNYITCGLAALHPPNKYTYNLIFIFGCVLFQTLRRHQPAANSFSISKMQWMMWSQQADSLFKKFESMICTSAPLESTIYLRARLVLPEPESATSMPLRKTPLQLADEISLSVVQHLTYFAFLSVA